MIFLIFLFYENCFDELIKINKTNKKMKRKKTICKPWGVLTPIEEVVWGILAQQEEALCWLFESHACGWLSVHDGLLLWPWDWSIRLRGQWVLEGVWWALGTYTAWKYMKQNNRNYLRGPGIRTQVPAFTKPSAYQLSYQRVLDMKWKINNIT